MCRCLLAHTGRQEANGIKCSYLISFFFFVALFLSEPRACQFDEADWLASSQDPPVLPTFSSAGVTHVYHCAGLLSSATDPDLVPHSCAASTYPHEVISPSESADFLIVPVLTMTVRSLLMYCLLITRDRNCAESSACCLLFYVQTLSGPGRLMIAFYRGPKTESRFYGVGLMVDKCHAGNWVLLTR